MRIRPPRLRWSLRAMLTLPLVCAILLVVVPTLVVQPYRRGWQDEQSALGAIRSAGGHVWATTRPIPAPGWRRRLAGPSRARYFERVRQLYFVASDPCLARPHERTFRYLESTISD